MKVKSLLLAGLWLAANSVALAQTPAKPAPGQTAATGAQAGGRTLHLKGGSGGGAILSREELRACMTQEVSIRSQQDELVTQRTALNGEKDAITGEQQALREQRAPIDAAKAQAEDLNGRMKAFAARVEDWTTRVNEFKAANRSGLGADREQRRLEKEGQEMEKERAVLEAERESVSAANRQAVDDYNTRIGVLDARVKDWNERNAQLSDRANKLEDGRLDWVTNCADRRYREDDEIAIKAGK